MDRYHCPRCGAANYHRESSVGTVKKCDDCGEKYRLAVPEARPVPGPSPEPRTNTAMGCLLVTLALPTSIIAVGFFLDSLKEQPAKVAELTKTKEQPRPKKLERPKIEEQSKAEKLPEPETKPEPVIPTYPVEEAWRNSGDLENKRVILTGEAIVKKSKNGVYLSFFLPTGRRIATVSVEQDIPEAKTDVNLECTVKGSREGQLVLEDAKLIK